MNEEEIERIVQSSKRMQNMGEFVNSDEADQLLNDLIDASMKFFVSMQDHTELSDSEVIGAVVGSVSAGLIEFIQFNG